MDVTDPDHLGPGSRTTVRRLRERARYDRATIHSILDEGLVCHLGFADEGQAVVIPTMYARDGDSLYVHGAAANCALRSAASPPGSVCVTVTLVDALVLARSWFHHSTNYRSVVAFGRAEQVSSPEEKARALRLLVERLVPGRASDSRAPTESELRATLVVRVDIEEASAKVRTGGPKEEPEDLDSGLWAGQIPLALVPGEPVPDDQGPVPSVPAYVADRRKRPEG